MKKFFTSPEGLLFSAIPLILLYLVIDRSGAIDLQFHDTYLVIANYHTGLVFVILLFLLSIFYWNLNKASYNRFLAWLHVVSTLLAIATILIVASLPWEWRSIKLPNWYSILIFCLKAVFIAQFILPALLIQKIIKKH